MKAPALPIDTGTAPVEDPTERIIPAPGTDEKAIAQKVQDLFEDSWRSKSVFHRQWSEFVALYESANQWLQWSDVNSRWVPNIQFPRGARPVSKNRVGPSVDQAVAILATTQPSLICPPASTDPEDRNRADVATAFIDKLLPMLETPRYDRLLKLWKGLTGTCCLESEWQSEDGKWVAQTTTDELGQPVPLTMGPDGPMPMTDPETQEPYMRPEGAIARRLYTSFEIFPDPASSGYDDAAWVVFAYTVSAKEAMRRLNLSKAEIDRMRSDGILTKVWSLLKRAFGGAQTPNSKAFEDGLTVLKLHQAPCAEAPGGRCITTIGDKTLYDEPSQTRGEFRFPFHVYYHGDHGKRWWGIGMVERVAEIQKELNRTLTRYSTTLHKMGNPRALIPSDSGINLNSWTDAVGQVTRYTPGDKGEKPEYMSGVMMPAGAMAYIQWLDESFDRVIGINESSSGVLPSSDTSGKAIKALQEKDVQRLAIVARADMDVWAKQAKYELFLVGNYWPEKTQVSLIGRDLQPFLLDFDRSIFSIPVDIEVESGEGTPKDPVERQQFLNQMFAPGGVMQTLPPTLRRMYAGLSRSASVRSFLARESLYEINTRVQIQQAMSGQPVVVMFNDDHSTALRLLSQFCVSEDFRAADDKQKAAVVDLIRQHATWDMQPKDGQGIVLPPGVQMPGAGMPPGPGVPAPGASPPNLQQAHEAAGTPPTAPAQGSPPRPPGAA